MGETMAGKTRARRGDLIRRRVAETMRGALVWAAVAIGVVCALDAAPGRAQEAEEIDLSQFGPWRDGFRVRALEAGVSAAVFDRAFDGVEPDMSVIELDRNQSEFNRAIWDYLGSAVSDTRVANGRAALAANLAALEAIEARYGVPKEIVVAIWGVESNYGANRGGSDVIRSLASLAFEGRRRARFEAELIAALMILQSGDVAPRDMVGSWAGAMGHTQFMPSSYLELAVDFDESGKRDIWSDNPIDALASTAGYLSARGWRTGEPWGVEVRLPAEFDYRLLDEGRQPIAFWAEKGVTMVDGDPLPAGIDGAELFLPAGASGPTFLVFPNFRVLLSYNPASSYALAVALLSERIEGAPEHPFEWPTANPPLARAEREELQEKLTELGFDTGGIDGIIGANSRLAIRRFQAANGYIADGYASEKLLDDVRQTLEARSSQLLSPQPQEPDQQPLGETELKEIQVFLQANGYYEDGPIDGDIGPGSERAMRAFVAENNLEIAPEASWEMLEALRAAALEQ